MDIEKIIGLLIKLNRYEEKKKIQIYYKPRLQRQKAIINKDHSEYISNKHIYEELEKKKFLLENDFSRDCIEDYKQLCIKLEKSSLNLSNNDDFYILLDIFETIDKKNSLALLNKYFIEKNKIFKKMIEKKYNEIINIMKTKNI